VVVRMKPSYQLWAASVGVLVAWGQALPGMAQTSAQAVAAAVKRPSQPTPQGDRPEPNLADLGDLRQVGAASVPLDTLIEAAMQAQARSQKLAVVPAPTAPVDGTAPTEAASTPKADAPASVETAQQTMPDPFAVPTLTPGRSLGTSPTSPDVQPSQPIGPAKAGVAPEYLNPAPNPLTFPTKPEEVKLRGIQPITLDQAIELAKRNNRDLQIAIKQLDRSRAALREQKAALYPTGQAQGNITQQQSASGQLQEEAAQKAQENRPRRLRNVPDSDQASLALTGTVGISYDIYTSGRRPALIRAAEQQVKSDQLQVEVTENQMRLDVRNGYYNLQEADESVRIQRAAVRNSEASLRDTIALERAGLGTRFDVLRAQVQLANARQDLTNALANQQVRRRELAQLLAIPPTLDLAAADTVKIAGTWDLSLPDSIVLAFKNRAELDQFLAQRELAEQQRKAALSALGPTVSLQVQYNILNNLRDNLGFGDGYSVAAGFDWNFFDGGAAHARAKQQEINKQLAETRFAQTRENIQLQVESAYANLRSTFENIGTNRQAVVQAREALRLARLRFQAGVGTQTEVINAENDLTRAEGNLVTAVIGYNRSLAALERAVTNLPIATGATKPSIPTPSTETGIEGT